ncbi:MAG: metal ABC transporter permease [Verrucomicrobiota bacterium]|nr:metal ABC transporter permease [Verrucomicrobiota bacterium]
MNWLIEPFHYDFMQRALLTCLMVGFTCGFMSVFIILRRLALTIDSLSHALLPGLALSVVFFGLGSIALFAGGLIAALFVAVGGEVIYRCSRVKHDTAVGILCAFSFAIGVIIIYVFKNDIRVDLMHYLFGNVLGVSDSDLWVQFATMLVIVPTMVVLQRPVLLTLFESSIASSIGIHTRALNFLIVIFMVCTVLSALQTVGLTLSLGLMVAPAATLYLFSNSVRFLMWGGAVIGALGSAAGLWLSYWIEAPAGPCMVLVIAGIFLLAVVFSPKYGVIRFFLHSKHRHEESLKRWQ